MGDLRTTCKVCAGPVHPNVVAGCTAYTCTTPCVECGHIGDVHRDWYAPGFCRRCPETTEARHDFEGSTTVASA